jgi:hypothetical protein
MTANVDSTPSRLDRTAIVMLRIIDNLITDASEQMKPAASDDHVLPLALPSVTL